MDQNRFSKTGNVFFRSKLKDFHKLGLPYDVYWNKAENDFIRFQEGKTEQGIRHCKSVENYIWILLQDYLRFFSPESLYLLSFCCAAHDIAKNSIDAFDHAHKAGEIIHNTFNKSGYVHSQGTADAIAAIVSAHDTGDFSSILPEYPIGEETTVFLRSLAAVFRLADMMDNCEGRAAKFYATYSLPLPKQAEFLNDVRNSIIGSMPSASDKTLIEVTACPSDRETAEKIELYVKGLNKDMTKEHQQLLQNLRTKYIRQFKHFEKSFSLPYRFELKTVRFQPLLARKRVDVPAQIISEPIVSRPILCYFLSTKTNVDLEKDLIDSLKAKKDIDSKYLYWKLSGTKNYLELCRNLDYTLPYVAENLLRDKFKSEIYPLLPHGYPTLDLIDLGPGYGEEPNIIVNTLLEKITSEDKINCILFDFSYHMLQMCVYYLDNANLEKPKYRDNVSVIAINGDIRDLPKFNLLIPDEGKSRLFVFLGGTIGNFLEKELLDIIRSMMTKEDFLLLGADLIGGLSDKELLTAYNSKYNQKFLFSPLSEVGYKIDDCKFECVVEETIGNIKNSKTVCSYFYLPDNTKVRVAFSTKYNSSNLRAYLVDEVKFNLLKMVTTTDEDYTLLLLSKKT